LLVHGDRRIELASELHLHVVVQVREVEGREVTRCNGLVR
jgi:hypothetical protein